MFARIRPVLCALALVLFGSVAHADTFTYNYSDTSGYSFTFSNPTLITSDTLITNFSACNENGSPCKAIDFNPSGDVLTLTIEGFVTNYQIGSLLSSGVGTNIGEFTGQTLIITDVPSQTPEPSSLMLLGTGIVGAGGMMRRRFIRG